MLEPALGRARPRLFGPVPVQLHPVLVRITQVESLAHAVVAGPVQRDARGASDESNRIRWPTLQQIDVYRMQIGHDLKRPRDVIKQSEL